ncbi:MAG: phage tail protein, partial [Bacteroidales bacterium]|nr:phage tail protein [Bacteroidales bacterium]
MKPILFSAGQTAFDTNGIGRLADAISCTVTEERNGQYELHMEYPLDGQLIEEIQYNRIVFATPADSKNPQPFRIYRISKPLSGVVEVDAEHISYQMSHIPIMPYTAQGLTPALDGLTTYAAETNPFTFSTRGQFGTVIANPFKVEQPENLRSLLFGQAGSFIDIYGGEWEFDGFDVILHRERGADNGVTIRYGKNLTNLKQEENIETTYTGICPFWRGQDEDTGQEELVTLPEMVLHSASAANYPYQRTKVVDLTSSFQEKPTVEQLRARGETYIESNNIGKPSVSLDVSFIALHQTQEYADLTHIEHINLCDTVKVVFPALD